MIGLLPVGASAAGAPATAPEATVGSAAPVEAASAFAAEQVDLLRTLRQTAGLALTPEQLQQITPLLGILDRAESTHRANVDRATAPVIAQLTRIQAAAAAGKAPDPKDQAAVDAAQAPLRPEGQDLTKLRKDTISKIRQILTPAQISEIRQALGIDEPAPNSTFGGGAPGGVGIGAAPAGVNGGPDPGPQPGAAPGGVGPGGAVAADPNTTGQPGGGNAADPNAGGRFGGRRGRGNPDEFIGQALDRMRTMPADQYAQMKDRMGGMMARISGTDPNSPGYAAAKDNFSSQMDKLREMPDAEYQGSRTQIVADIVQKMAVARENRDPEQVISNDEAVRRFFTRPGVLPYLAAQTARR